MKDPIKRQSAMLRMLDDGMTLDEIGKVFGISHQRVQQVIRSDYTKNPTLLPAISSHANGALLRAGLNTRPKIVAALRSGKIHFVNGLGLKRINQIRRAFESV